MVFLIEFFEGLRITLLHAELCINYLSELFIRIISPFGCTKMQSARRINEQNAQITRDIAHHQAEVAQAEMAGSELDRQVCVSSLSLLYSPQH